MTAAQSRATAGERELTTAAQSPATAGTRELPTAAQSPATAGTRELTTAAQSRATEGERELTAQPRPAATEVARDVSSSPSIQEQLLALPGRPAAAAGVAAGALLILLAVWIGLRATSTSQTELQPTAVPVPKAAITPIIAKKPDSPIEKPATGLSGQSALPPAVLHEVTPDVPQNVRDKIKGRIFVMVRVLVDPSGNVVGALMEDPGRSKHFARLAENAARDWRFVPSEKQRPRVWILKFAFTRDGVTARVIEQ